MQRESDYRVKITGEKVDFRRGNMTKVMPFNNFKTSYTELKNNTRNRFLIEFYHHDFPSEPTLSVLDNVLEVVFDRIEGESYISIRLFSDTTDITFKSGSYHTNLSNGDVVFSSKHDNETYCLISFPQEDF